MIRKITGEDRCAISGGLSKSGFETCSLYELNLDEVF